MLDSCTSIACEGHVVRIFCCPAVHDDCTIWQGQWTPLLIASNDGNTGAVRVLVESKADIEARNEVAMWPVQPVACSISGGGGDLVQAGPAAGDADRACR